MRISAVIPCYNEKFTIEAIIEKASSAQLPHDWSKEIIVVDDGSTDGTREVLKEYQDKLKVIFKERNEGKGAALKAGFKAATGDYIIVQDADLEYDPKDYLRLVGSIEAGKPKVVFGIRKYVKGQSLLFYFGGHGLIRIFNFLFGTKIRDLTTCYKVFPKSLVPKLISIPANDFIFDAVWLSYILVSSGFEILQIPISYYPRAQKEGKKIRIKDGVKILMAMFGIKKQELLQRLGGKWLKGALKFAAFLVVPVLIYTAFVLQNINSPFIRVSEDENGTFGIQAINIAERGVAETRMGLYGSLLPRGEKLERGKFYVHHPSFFVAPNVLAYKLFGVSEATTRLPSFVFLAVSLVLFFFALWRLIGEPKFGFWTLLVFAILPGAVYYGKIFNMIPYTIAFMLVTFSLFIFLYFSKRRFYLYLFLASIAAGGLISWFYYFFPLSIFILLFGRHGKDAPYRRALLIFIPALLVAAFMLNVFHFYLLNGPAIFEDLKNAFLVRSAGQPFSSWLNAIYQRASLNFNGIFLITSFVGALIFFGKYCKDKKFGLLLPILLSPVLTLAVFRQWSTHPFGLSFFLPAVAVLSAVLFYRLEMELKVFGIAVALIILAAGFYMSWQKLDFFYNKFLILGPKDIQMLKEIKPRIASEELCEGGNQFGLGYTGIIQWYLEKKTLHSPTCFEKNPRIGLVFRPAFGKFYEDEANMFSSNSFRPVGCADALCVVEKR